MSPSPAGYPAPWGHGDTQPGPGIISRGHPSVLEHRSQQPQWDVLTGGPGKPGWPWKPCGETRTEPDPNGRILPYGGPGDPHPCRTLGDAHLVPLLAGTAREPTLAPRSLRKEGARWVGSTSLHPQPPRPSPLPPHSPPGTDQSGHLPLALRDLGGRPSRGVPGKGRNWVRWMWREGPQIPVATARGGTWENPQPLCPWSTALRDSPVPLSPQGGPRSLAHL